MVPWKIYIIVLVPIVAIGLIFKHLITTNKIKLNKVSKLFYYDDESFIRSWRKTEEKGFLRYTLKNIIFATAVMGIMGIFFLLNKRSMFGYEQSQTLFVALSLGVTMGIIHSIIWWIGNQVRDRQIKEKGL